MSVVHRTDFDNTTNHDLLRGGLRKTFDSTQKTIETYFSNMFNVLTTDQKIERDIRMAGLGLAEVKEEGAPTALQEMKLDTIKEYTQITYGTGFAITQEMKKFNKFKQMEKLTKSLARSMKLTKDITVAALWNSPTATYTGYDTQVLGYASHTCLDDASSVYDNIYSAALSTTGIETGLLYFKKMKDDQGQYTISVVPDTLYFEPTQMFTADILFGSNGMPFEESNSKNPYSKFGIKQFPYIRLTSTTAWGMLCKKDELFDVNVFTSMEPDMKVEDASNRSRDTIVTSNEMYAFGFGDPRMVWIGNT